MELFSVEAIDLDVTARDKQSVLDYMVNVLDKAGKLNDARAYRQEIENREQLSTTGIGFGIAIPHAKTAAVKEAHVAVGISKNGIDYGSEDGSKVHLVFMIAATADDSDLHLRMLASLARKLIDPVYRQKLLDCRTKPEVLDLLKEIA